MKLRVEIPNHEYDIILEHGLLHHVLDYLHPKGKSLIISDTGVPKQYLNLVCSQLSNCFTYIVEQGEVSKSFPVYQAIVSYLLAHDFQRTDCIIALGGGVVGDLAGFVAATYMRGIEFINIPTTTLSQIDSSIGGKVAINLDGVKNMIGSFYQPSLVLIDPDVLSTLPQRQLVSGLAEALKAGLILNKELFHLFKHKDYKMYLDEIIYQSLLVKKQVVECDEKETGLRKLLNFGHTIGHGIEAYYLHDLYHGEAVAIGMLYFIENNKLKQQVKQIYKQLGLPSEITYEKEEVWNHIMHDKKANHDTIDVIVVKEVGVSEIVSMPFKEIKERL